MLKERGRWTGGSFDPAPGMIVFFDGDSPDEPPVRRMNFLAVLVLLRRLDFTVIFHEISTGICSNMLAKSCLWDTCACRMVSDGAEDAPYNDRER